jgi:hypothetical protein
MIDDAYHRLKGEMRSDRDDCGMHDGPE